MSWIEDLIKSRLVQLSDTVHDTVAPIIYNARTREKTEKLVEEGTERLRQLRMQGKQAVFRPDNRTSDQRARDSKEADYKRQLYQKAKDDSKDNSKIAEGLEILTNLLSPSTYVEAAIGKRLSPAVKLATDIAVFGIAGGAKRLLTRGLTKGNKVAIGLAKGIGGDARLSPELWTAALDAAIARGDMAEALRLRDLHSKYDTYLHATLNDFNLFEIIRPYELFFHFDKNPNVLKLIPHNKIMEVKLKFDNPRIVLDAGRWNWPRILESNPDIAKKLKMDEYQIRDYFNSLVDKLGSEEAANNKIMEMLGNDAFLYRNYIEGTGGFSVAIPKASHIKLADAVTYDNNGIRIPLGQRDNYVIKDIRWFSTQPVTRANPVHTTGGNPLETRLSRLREHTLYGFTPETNLGLMVTPLLRVNNVRSFAKQIDPSLTEDLLDLIVQIAYANGRGVHIPIGNSAGLTTGGISIVDILDAINYLKLSGVNATSHDIGIIAGHEAGHGVQVSPAAREAVADFAEPEEFYTRAGLVLDNAGVTSTANEPISYGKFMQFVNDYLKQGNLDNGVTALKNYMANLSPVKRLKIMAGINRFSVGAGVTYLATE